MGIDLRTGDDPRDNDFGPRCVIHVGGHSYGVADYYYHPWGGPPHQVFTMIHLGPAGYVRSLSVAGCLVTAIVLAALTICLGVRYRRRRLHTK
jgi:hypothetical protein